MNPCTRCNGSGSEPSQRGPIKIPHDPDYSQGTEPPWKRAPEGYHPCRPVCEKDASLLGKRVRITINRDQEPQVVVVGQLLAFGDMGEVVVLDDADDVMHCWPMLDIEEE